MIGVSTSESVSTSGIFNPAWAAPEWFEVFLAPEERRVRDERRRRRARYLMRARRGD